MLHRLLLAMAVLAAAGMSVALLDPRNSVGVTLVFYGLIFGWLAVVLAVARRGRVVFAAWVFALFFWSLIAFVTLAFGGLQGQNASTFAVCTLLIGSVVGGRAAIAMAIASSLWCGLVMLLEQSNRLPFQLGPYTPVNAWTCVTVTVLMTSVLLHESLKSLRASHAEAQKASLERDEALRRSIQGQKLEIVGSLTSGIAHDLNNLLTVIVGAVDVLRAECDPKDSATLALLDDLDAASSRSALMTRQLLAFGRANLGASEPVNLAARLQDSAKMMSRLVGSAIEIAVEPHAAEQTWIQCSHAALEQILLNLVVNARDAMPQGGSLRLSTSVEGDRVVLSVKDTGIGMSTEVRARVFDPFFTTKNTGTGLGLATTLQLVTQHAGRIQIQSEPGQGSVFHISFPKVAAPAGWLQSSLPTPTLATLGGGRRILVVEDDPLVRRALTRMLTLDGYDVTAVQDGDEALSLAGTIAPSLTCVVTDVSMRRIDGVTLATRLGQEYAALPVILISGNKEPALAQMKGSPREFLPKPVTHAELRDAIRRVTQPRHVLSANKTLG